ncbi:aminopeptidase [Jiulongibacter sp. NS-SX5]|uniref:aminopeptidase n=1 Tax=Jiulongibacter sp. NS-SX5 TaxID=3463854 RepID=UPI00405A0D3A
MKKVFRAVLILLVFAIGIFYAFNFKAVNYGLAQLKGQMDIIFNTVPIEDLLTDQQFPDSLKEQIRYIEEIKKFTVDSLGLKPSGSYQSYYDQKGEPILWVITACSPYKLDPKKWKFPIVGEFAYKGHFEKEKVQKEVSELKELGYDIRVGEVSAWSTLGYLDDPILSSMLEKDKGQLAALIIHELTHGTLFVKNDLAFNENLADFVGDEGAKIFLRSKFGEDSKEFQDYENSKLKNEEFSQLMVAGAEKLDSLFQTFDPQMASNEKDSLKYQLIDSLMFSAERIFNDSTRFHYRGRGTVNNASFTSYLTYQGKQTFFKEELESKFNNNFKVYLEELKKKYSSIGI